MGFLLLEGGSEFGGKMAEPDLRALELAGGLEAPVAILPTAAAPDHNDQRAGNNGRRWFGSLGATRVDVVPVVDQKTANQEELAARVRSAKLVYMLGGFPDYLAATLAGSQTWQAALDGYAAGGVLGGSSAGAMVLGEYLYTPKAGKVGAGLGVLLNTCVIPHHNNFGKGWLPMLREALPEAVLIGIDEQTGMLNDLPGQWTVYGAGRVTIYQGSAAHNYSRGESFRLPESVHP